MTISKAHELVERELLLLAKEEYKTTTRIAKALGVNQSTISRKLRKL
jgi:predicted transcriptional regulator